MKNLWSRLFCAVVCWFVSVLTIMIIAVHYTPPIPPSIEQHIKMLIMLSSGISMFVVILAVLAFWLWVWTRKYWY